MELMRKMNIKSLFSKPERFTNYEALSPAARAARKWDEREGEIIVQNYNLRRLLVGMLAVVVVLTISLVYKSLSSNVMPYIVEVDTTTGMVKNVGTVAASAHYKPSEAVNKYFLSRFLKNTREIPLDPVVYKENLTTSYGFLTKDAAKKLQTMLKTEKLTEKFGHQTVQINIATILPMESEHSYQIRWTEETFTISNGEKKVTPYSGIFTVQTIRSDDETRLMINPIGLYISDFSWSKDASAVNTESTTNVNKK
jgi:type IV secretion system protein VirB5